tara:strand:+ start:1452 stop:1688 length:237 start_codon:yes stop_codon:yes gene_type:complete
LGHPVGATDVGLLPVIHQTLVKMTGTDGKKEEGQVVVEISAGEACPTTVTRRLKKPMRKKPPFLRCVSHGLSRDWTQY